MVGSIICNSVLGEPTPSSYFCGHVYTYIHAGKTFIHKVFKKKICFMCISVLLARTYAHCVYGLQLLATVSFYMRLRTKSRSSAWTIHVFNHRAIFPIVPVVCLRMRVGSQAHNSRHPLMPAEEDKSFGAGVAGEWEPLDMSASNRMWILRKFSEHSALWSHLWAHIYGALNWSWLTMS